MRRLCVDEARPGKNGGASAPDSRQHPRQPRTPVGHATFLAMITILLASVYTPIAGPVHQPAFALGRPGAGIEGGAATMRRLLIPSAWCEQAQSPSSPRLRAADEPQRAWRPPPGWLPSGPWASSAGGSGGVVSVGRKFRAKTRRGCACGGEGLGCTFAPIRLCLRAPRTLQDGWAGGG
ncbi:hypothetical protein T484DRAFT_1896656, partial [Baffinella frigidus]